MRLLELTLPTPAANLALDEALLDEAESLPEVERRAGAGEILRLWESPTRFVVVGRSSRVSEEVNEAECHRQKVPILRRSSGGAAVVVGPGCLMYAVVLSYDLRPDLHDLSRAHRFVLERIQSGLAERIRSIAYRGTSDLALGMQKFSGNSLRCKRHHFVYHGTLLYDFPLAEISKLLLEPPRQPDYRERRPHGEFVTNLSLSRKAIRDALIEAWDANNAVTSWPEERVEKLIAERYGREQWNRRYPA